MSILYKKAYIILIILLLISIAVIFVLLKQVETVKPPASASGAEYDFKLTTGSYSELRKHIIMRLGSGPDCQKFITPQEK